MRNKGLEFNFAWIFAIIVGAAIISLAIYGASNFIKTERKIEDSSKGVELSALLRQLETGIEQQGTAKINNNVKIRITNGCTMQGDTLSEKTFGTQKIQTSVASGLDSEEFANKGIPFESQSIYLFSNKTIEGKEFNTLTKSFEYPYKVADLVMVWPSTYKYCFINAPDNMIKELENTNIGLNFSNSKSNCPTGSIKVCFAQTGCDIDVSQSLKNVKKAGKTINYDSIESALFYAAIFSDPELYECQVQRLAKKASTLGRIYSEKASYGAALGCSAETLQPIIDSLSSQLSSATNSNVFSQTEQLKEELKQSNNALICQLF